ncbi:MAG: YjiG family protein [Negativicutes bacterium]
MTNTTSTSAQPLRKTVPDIFVDGAKKGWTIGINNMLPNVVMAFSLIQILRVTGALDILARWFAPIMGIFALPGESIMVLAGAWMSMGGGVGVAASLYAAGKLNQANIAILLPAIFLMGAQMQYMGRCLGTSGVNPRYYPAFFGISIMNAILAMLVMRFLV